MPYRLLDPQEAAEYLNLRPDELERLIKDGKIPCEKRGPRVVFRRADLDAWASRRTLSDNERGLARYDEQATERARRRATPEIRVAELIRPGQIDAALPARTRASVIREMVALAERTGWVYDPAELIKSLEAREELCSTAVPGGVAFLHPRVQDPYRFQESFLILGRVVQPVHFNAPDGQPTDLFFLLCTLEDPQHLPLLARLCLLAHKTDLLEQLRAAPDAEAMHAVLVASEQEVLDRLN